MQAQQKILTQKAKDIQFEFVEAPPKTHLQKPEDSPRISDRDALNQNRVEDQPGLHDTPNIKTQGVMDQLAQKQASDARAAIPRVEPSSVQKTDVARLPDGQGDQKSDRPPVNPQTPIQGLTGQDKITTQEMTKFKSRGAEIVGITSFEATGSGMGAYMKNLKEKIWLSWFPYLAFKYPQDFKSADVLIRFTLNQKGEVKILQVLESQGSPLFASVCMDAIQRASGFGEVPQEMLALTGKDEIEIKFGFHYR